MLYGTPPYVCRETETNATNGRVDDQARYGQEDHSGDRADGRCGKVALGRAA